MAKVKGGGRNLAGKKGHLSDVTGVLPRLKR